MLYLPKEPSSNCIHINLLLSLFPLCLKILLVSLCRKISSSTWIILRLSILIPDFLTLHLKVQIVPLLRYLSRVLHIVPSFQCGHFLVPLHFFGICVLSGSLIALDAPLHVGALLDLPHFLDGELLWLCCHFS